MSTPGDFRKLLTSSRGINWGMRKDDQGRIEFVASGDSEAVLDRNKQIHNHGVHRNAEKDRYLAASIPPIIEVKWLTEEGLNIHDPNHRDRLRKKLNDPEWSHLRIWKGRL